MGSFVALRWRLVVGALLFSCGSGASVGGIDAAAHDASVVEADASAVDAPVVEPDAAMPDALTAEPDAAIPDALAAEPDATDLDLEPVECRSNEDCPGHELGSLCYMDVPGGICRQSCNEGTACLEGTECWAGEFCVRPCETSDDCNPGLECDPGDMHCRPRPCAWCEAPYVCGLSSYLEIWACVRPPCSDGTCPAPLVCDGDWCVEPL